MKTMAMIFVILSTIFLSGCRSIPDELITRQKFIHLEFVEIDGKKYVDIDASFCVERDYKYSKNFIGPISKFKNVSFEQCDKLTGLSPVQYVNVTNWFEDVRKEIESHE